MATNLELNDGLILEAMQWGKHKTKKAAVTAALKYYIDLKNRQIKDQLSGGQTQRRKSLKRVETRKKNSR